MILANVSVSLGSRLQEGPRSPGEITGRGGREEGPIRVRRLRSGTISNSFGATGRGDGGSGVSSCHRNTLLINWVDVLSTTVES